MSEISTINIERLSDKCYNVTIDFGEPSTLQIGIDNTENDVTPRLLNNIMEALQRAYKLSFNDMLMLRRILKSLLRRVM